MLAIETGVLKDNALYQDIVDFVLSQSTDGSYNSSVMTGIANNKGHFAVALDGDTVVGTSLNFELPADHFFLPQVQSFLTESGINNTDCVSVAGVYVDPNYSGQQLADRLSIAKSEFSIAEGYTYTMLWGYGTQAIFDYSTRIGNLIDTGIDDTTGFRIYMRRLSDVVSALTDAD